MRRQTFFKHYMLIALVVGLPAIAAVLVFAESDKLALLGAVFAGILSFFYFVQQQKLAEIALFKELFTEFNKRYDDLNNRLASINCVNATDEERLDITSFIIDYFNLCAEEYLFYKMGYIHDAVWKTWCTGMLQYLNKEPFKTLWEKESVNGSYYGLSLKTIQEGKAIRVP